MAHPIFESGSYWPVEVMIGAVVAGLILAAIAARTRRFSRSRGFTLAAVICLTVPTALSLIRPLPCLDVPVAVAASAGGVAVILWACLPYPATHGEVIGFFSAGIGIVVAALCVATIPSASSYFGATVSSRYHYCSLDPILRCETDAARHLLVLLSVAVVTGLSLIAVGVFIWGSLRHTDRQAETTRSAHLPR